MSIKIYIYLFIICFQYFIFLNWSPHIIDKFVFELEFINTVTVSCFYLSALLLLFYAFLPHLTKVEFYGWLFCVSICLPIAIVFSIQHLFDGYPHLITRRSEGSINRVSVYESYSPALTTGGDNANCRYRLVQQRVFPGIVQNKQILDSPEDRYCIRVSDTDEFPDYLR